MFNIVQKTISEICVLQCLSLPLPFNIVTPERHKYTSHWLKKLDMGQKVKLKIYLLVQFLFVNVPQN